MMRRRFLAVPVGVMVLGVGLVLANYGGGVTPAAAAPPAKDDPHAGLTQNWDSNLPIASRFITVFTGAVRDNNTGLVWEQTLPNVFRNWDNAAFTCLRKNIGGAVGWRLPSVVELMSVQDGSPEAVAPFVPASVFTGVLSVEYWSASTVPDGSNDKWFVDFSTGQPSHDPTTSINKHSWCVRGPMQESVY